MKSGSNLVLKVRDRLIPVVFMDDKRFNKVHGLYTLAAYRVTTKELHFRSRNLTKDTVIHELIHAYIDTCHTEVMEIDSTAMEELCCEVVSQYIDQIIENCSIILDYIKDNNKL